MHRRVVASNVKTLDYIKSFSVSLTQEVHEHVDLLIYFINSNFCQITVFQSLQGNLDFLYNRKWCFWLSYLYDRTLDAFIHFNVINCSPLLWFFKCLTIVRYIKIAFCPKYFCHVSQTYSFSFECVFTFCLTLKEDTKTFSEVR